MNILEEINNSVNIVCKEHGQFNASTQIMKSIDNILSEKFTESDLDVVIDSVEVTLDD